MSDDLAHGPDEDPPRCRACGVPANRGVVAAYACGHCGERNPYTSRESEAGEPSGPFDGASFGREIEEGRERLKEIQREAGFVEDEDAQDHHKLWRYIELLESTVVGQHAAAVMISRALRP